MKGALKATPSEANPKVTAIIPSYNGERYISHAIESVLAQTYKNIEIIVVDDGSTDRSLEKVRPYLSRIKYIFQENSGVCNARNAGISNSNGELIAFLDCDDRWLPEKIERQVSYFSANPQEKFVHCAVKFINSRGEGITPEDYWRNLRFNGEVKDVKEIFMHFAMLPSAMMVKRQLFDEVGLWDQEFALCEGYNLCLRIALRYPLRFINEPLVLYRLHDANCSNTIGFDLKRIKVVESFLMERPDSYKIIGRRDIKMRLLGLYSAMARFLLSTGDYAQARKYFLKAYKKRPSDPEYLKEFFWYSLTASQRKSLLWYKEKLKSVLKNAYH
ncbi:MAG: glycosyltransferase family 2 protein [Nitrospirae bacterium]|nr:glycosyltransferase family 2 protein [Nitrospirota bacterium]